MLDHNQYATTISAPSVESNPFSGYFFKVPDELLSLLTKLTPAQLKTYLVVLHAIQKDRNAGQLSIRQIADRANLSSQHTQPALKKLVELRLLEAIETSSKTTVYSLSFPFRTKPDCTPVGEQSTRPGAQRCSPLGVQHCTPVGEQHLESLENTEKVTSSSSSGSSKPSTLPHDEEDGLLFQNFLQRWMSHLHRNMAYPQPPPGVMADIRRVSPGWTDEQRIEGFRQNTLVRKPNVKNPPNGYGYFVTVMRNYYEQCGGEPPALPAPTPIQEPVTENLSSNVPVPESSPAVSCPYCRNTGSRKDGGGYCLCEKGAEGKRRSAEKLAIRQAYEAEKVRHSQQTEEWLVIAKHQSPGIRYAMDFGELCRSFSSATIEERDQILQQIREDGHAGIMPYQSRKTGASMALADSQTAAA